MIFILANADDFLFFIYLLMQSQHFLVTKYSFLKKVLFFCNRKISSIIKAKKDDRSVW